MQTQPPSRERFYHSLEQMLNLPAGSIHGSEDLRELKSWDSLAILEFMTMASMEYDSDVEPADLAECKTVDDLAGVVFRARSPASRNPDANRD